MGKNEREMRLGELIKALGLVKETQLAATLRRALQVGLPLGRALVMSGYLTEDELSVALEMQALLRADEITLADGTQAFALASSEGISLAEALKRLGVLKAAEARSLDAKLGTLLVDSGRVTAKVLEDAQKKSVVSGSPLARTLSLTGVVSTSVLEKAQELQNMIREGMVNYGDAVKTLKSARERKVPPDTSNGKDTGDRALPKKIRLAELLTLSKIVSEKDMAEAVELAFTVPSTIGEILIDMALVSQETLTLAFELQRSISEGNLEPVAAAETLHYVATTGDTDTSHAPHTKSGPYIAQDNIRLGELLRMCGLVNNKDIDDALNLSHKCSSLIGEMLVLTGVIGQATLISALRCQSLLRRGLLRLEEGVKALQYSNQHSVSFDDALETIGVSVHAGATPGTSSPD
jgi:hypothetical protein